MPFKDWLKRALMSLAPAPRRSLLVYSPREGPNPLVHGFKRVGSAEEIGAPLRWLPPSETEFDFPVLDCRSVTRGTISTAQTEEQLERYISLRNDTGRDLARHHPTGRSTPCSLCYDLLSPAPLGEGRLYTSRRLEYKWDIAYWESAFLFSRSWTGELIYRAGATLVGSALTLTSVEASGEAEVPGPTSAFDVAAVDFLVRSHVFQSVAPHPLPSPLRDAPERTAALWTMRYFGSEARFGYDIEAENRRSEGA